jgi:seryl-tRNA synthetase
MPEETATGAGQTAGDGVEQLSRQLKEQRDIQSGLDKRIGELEAERNALTAQVGELTTSKDDALDQLTTLRTEHDGILAQFKELQSNHETALAERDTFQAESTGFQEALQRHKVLASVARDHPALLVLAAEGALPVAESIEDFEASLRRMGGAIDTGVKVAAQGIVNNVLDGARPEPDPKGQVTTDPDKLYKEIIAAQSEGDFKKAAELSEVWRKLST